MRIAFSTPRTPARDRPSRTSGSDAWRSKSFGSRRRVWLTRVATVAPRTMATDPRFPELVSLAAHDLRTPLATVSGFASTLLRLGTLDPQSTRYVELIEASGAQLAEIVDDLGVVARIQGGRFEPALDEADSLELASAAGERLGEQASVSGNGQAVRVDSELAARSLAGLAYAALRHGGAERMALAVDG